MNLSKLSIDGGSPVRSKFLPMRRVNYGYEELHQILEVFERGVFCSVYPDAPKVRMLESAFAAYSGSTHAVAFNSGTTAQHASLVAAGIGPGDEVIIPPLTFASTAYTILMMGAKPVFADVDDDTIIIDSTRVAEAITSRTRAIVPVHWFGHPAAMEKLLELADVHRLTVIEDCAHAYGTAYRGKKAGTMGAMACWSLQEGKMITAAGEGGLLTTNDDRLAEIARSVCDHGKDKGAKQSGSLRYWIVRVGNNYRLSEIQAAFALAQLNKIEALRAARKDHTEYLDNALTDLPGLRRPQPWNDVELSYAYYPLRFDEEYFRVDLSQISAALTAEGIGNATMREELCPLHPLFIDHCGTVSLPVAERIARELVLLPLYPDLSRADLNDIIAAVSKVVATYA
ncbi:MAG TPA: DegT/DnrJ/EryC1/StrS family aminotransferase [Acidobacteriota bacterium]|jgi:dTDP-4-amino-4,6-dideoxygalactose transaminase|nr:DegT/DnrJ/EryC1/StrS family aminotransferase [Acidobacteriota bacterium]